MRLSAAFLGFLLLSACVFHGSPAGAQGVGDEIVVESAHVNGVPLHRESRSSMIGRVPNQSPATILELAQDGRWQPRVNAGR